MLSLTRYSKARKSHITKDVKKQISLSIFLLFFLSFSKLSLLVLFCFIFAYRFLFQGYFKCVKHILIDDLTLVPFICTIYIPNGYHKKALLRVSMLKLATKQY